MRYVIVIILCGMVASAAEPEMRNWELKDGSLQRRALIKVEDNVIYWKDASGKESKCFLADLCKEDREYIRLGCKPTNSASAAVSEEKNPDTGEYKMRRWTTVKGKTYDRIFVELKDGKVFWKDNKGDVKSAPLDQLSQEDQDYVDEILVAEDDDLESDEADSESEANAKKKNGYLKEHPEINRIYKDVDMVCTHIAQTRKMYRDNLQRTKSIAKNYDKTVRTYNKGHAQEVTGVTQKKTVSVGNTSVSTSTSSKVMTTQEKQRNYKYSMQSSADIMYMLGDCRKRCQDFRAEHIEEPILKGDTVESGVLMVEWERLKSEVESNCLQVRGRIR